MYGRDIARRERMMGEQKNVMGDLGVSVEKKFLVEWKRGEKKQGQSRGRH